MRSHITPPGLSTTAMTPSRDKSEKCSRATYTISEVAEMFSVCKRTIKRRYQDRSFPKPLNGLGRVVRFDAADIDRFRRQCDPR
jgi:predicted DNA-binding transcriptional regulator AlpA